MESIYYLYISGAIVMVVLLVGWHYEVQILDKPVYEQNFKFKHFDVTIKKSNQNNKFNGLITATDNLQYDISIKNKFSDIILVEHSVQVNKTLETIYEVPVSIKEVPKSKDVSFTVVIPMKEEGNHLVRHNFIAYFSPESKPIDGATVDYFPLVLTRADYIEIVQLSVLVKFAWIIGIPLILGSMKVVRDFIENK